MSLLLSYYYELIILGKYIYTYKITLDRRIIDMPVSEQCFPSPFALSLLQELC